jgi:hypothetical protein
VRCMYVSYIYAYMFDVCTCVGRKASVVSVRLFSCVMYVRMHTCLMYVCIQTYTHPYMFDVCAHTYTHTHMFDVCAHKYIHTHTHTRSYVKVHHCTTKRQKIHLLQPNKGTGTCNHRLKPRC